LKPVKAVIFDFGGVLCFHPTKEQIARASAECGMEPREFVAALWKNRLVYDGGLDSYEYWRGVAEIAGRKFDDALIARMIEYEIDFWSKLDERMLAWVGALRADGYKTAILSNLPRPLGARLRQRDGFLDRFDHITFSFELGVVKPQREIYDDAVHGVGVAPGDALFIDDRPENIEGAHAAGLQAELYSTWENFGDVAARYGLPRIHTDSRG
jgi:putative hydrolase of the HAD superfamily